MRKDFILVLDLETTGNDRKEDEICEFGAVLLNEKGDEVASINIPIRPSAYGMERLMANDVVREMHTTSGLLVDIQAENLPDVAAAEDIILDWLDNWTGTSTEHIPYGGSGVSHFDRDYLVRDMPNLMKRLSHWTYDVAVLRRVFQLADVPPFRMTGKTHRSIDDARVHAEELRQYVSLISHRMGRLK